MDWLSSLPTGQITAGALVALIVLLILRGNLVPRQNLIDSQAREARAMDLADKWQKVATEQGMTLHRLLDYAEAADHAISEIQAVLLRPRGEEASQ